MSQLDTPTLGALRRPPAEPTTPDNVMAIVRSMRTRRLFDYALPGLNSSMLELGCVRLFESDRLTEEHITPHSHRFDFACLVLEGAVENTLYIEDERGEDFIMTGCRSFNGGLGNYERLSSRDVTMLRSVQTYTVGQWYSMLAREIHSIKFSRGATVLFLEGPEVADSFDILEPWTAKGHIKTFETKPWMFQPG